LRYKAYAVRSAIGAAVGGALGVAMALAGFGIWSFVGAQVGQGLASAITVWAYSEWRPRLAFSARALSDLAPFSAQTIAGAMLDLMATRVDVLAVGLALDATSMGYYYLLKRLLQTATSATLYPAFSLVTPTLRRLVNEPTRFNRAYVSLVSVAHASWVFVATGFLACAPDVLPTVFGARWAGAVPLLQAASVLGIAFAVGFCTSQALGVVGQARAYLSLAVAQVVLTGGLVGVAAQFNVTATGAALGISFILSLPLNLWALRRHITLDPRDLIAPCVYIATAGAVTAGVVLAARSALGQAYPSWPVAGFAVFDIVLCTLVYAAAVRIAAPGVFYEVIEVARSVVRHPRPADVT
jgi:O-antigen/teichoic acid export membrane protein